MEKFECGVCGRSGLLESERKAIKLTEDEQKFVLASTGEDPPDEYIYCKPCMRLLQNRLSGAELLKGNFLINLREAGVPNADKVADRYFKWLIKKAAPEPLS